MVEIIYFPEREAKELVASEVKSNLDKGFIKSPEGFAAHCVDTGNIAEKVANIILERYPLIKPINPVVLRTGGYVHDIGKIYQQDPWHEIVTAEKILDEGEGWGLVIGGTKSERYESLRQIAALIPSDSTLYEQIGGEDFPRTPYPEEVVLSFCEFEKRVNELRRRLSTTKNPLSIRDFSIPFTYMQKIAVYADLANVEGRMTDVAERIDDCTRRYDDSKGNYYDPVKAKLFRTGAGARMLQAAKTIEILI